MSGFPRTSPSKSTMLKVNGRMVDHLISFIAVTWPAPLLIGQNWCPRHTSEFPLTYRHEVDPGSFWTRNTKTGGWVEFQDFNLNVYSDDGSLQKDSYVNKLHILLKEACAKIGRTTTPGENLEKWTQDAGFKNIQHKAYKIPLGTWPKDPKFVRRSRFYSNLKLAGAGIR